MLQTIACYNGVCMYTMQYVVCVYVCVCNVCAMLIYLRIEHLPGVKRKKKYRFPPGN